MKKSLFIALAAAIAVSFTSCSNDDSGNGFGSLLGSYVKPTLPESVGTNPFTGKTFSDGRQYDAETWAFESDTVRRFEPHYEEYFDYYYTVDTDKKTISLCFKTYLGRTWADMEKLFSEHPDLSSSDEFSSLVEMWLGIYESILTYKYELSGTNLSLTEYFPGDLKTEGGELYCFAAGVDYAEINESYFTFNDNTPNDKRLVGRISATINNKFDINLYYYEYTEENKTSFHKKLGKASGTYTVSTEDSGSVTLTFTSLPEIPYEGFDLVKNTPFTFNFNSNTKQYTETN